MLLRILKILDYLRFDQKPSKYWIFYNTTFLFLSVALNSPRRNPPKSICTPLNIWKSIKINPEQIHRPKIQIWAQNHRSLMDRYSESSKIVKIFGYLGSESSKYRTWKNSDLKYFLHMKNRDFWVAIYFEGDLSNSSI